MKFHESLIKFEALTQTPLKEAFGGIALDKQIEILESLIESVKLYAEMQNLPHPDRKTWDAFKKTANWDLIAKQALMKKTFFTGKTKITLDTLTKI